MCAGVSAACSRSVQRSAERGRACVRTCAACSSDQVCKGMRMRAHCSSVHTCAGACGLQQERANPIRGVHACNHMQSAQWLDMLTRTRAHECVHVAYAPRAQTVPNSTPMHTGTFAPILNPRACCSRVLTCVHACVCTIEQTPKESNTHIGTQKMHAPASTHMHTRAHAHTQASTHTHTHTHTGTHTQGGPLPVPLSWGPCRCAPAPTRSAVSGHPQNPAANAAGVAQPTRSAVDNGAKAGGCRQRSRQGVEMCVYVWEQKRGGGQKADRKREGLRGAGDRQSQGASGGCERMWLCACACVCVRTCRCVCVCARVCAEVCLSTCGSALGGQGT